MTASSKNQRRLAVAKSGRNDEFYTTRETVEAELNHYKDDFTGRIVVCNCNDHPARSEFTRFFIRHMADWQIPRLIATSYQPDEGLFDTGLRGYRYELINDGRTTPYTVEDFQITKLAGTGGFETPECQPLLDIPNAIVCTNPPFSRAKDFLPMLDRHGTSFLILTHMNAVTYNSVFPIVLEGRCWFGLSIHSSDRPFLIPDDYPRVGNNLIFDQQGRAYAKVTGVRWLTNLPAGLADKTDRIADYRTYKPEEFSTYDSFDAIEVAKVRDIPADYTGLMGVPITFLDHWSPHSRFQLVGQLNHGNDPRYDPAKPVIDGHIKYKRLLIQQKGQES